MHRTPIPWYVVVLCTGLVGCGGPQPVAVPDRQQLDQFQSYLQSFEQALSQTPQGEELETFSDDLVSRLDKLIGIAHELEFSTSAKPEAAALATAIATALNEMARAAEGTPQVEVLRQGAQKVKEQVGQLGQKL